MESFFKKVYIDSLMKISDSPHKTAPPFFAPPVPESSLPKTAADYSATENIPESGILNRIEPGRPRTPRPTPARYIFCKT